MRSARGATGRAWRRTLRRSVNAIMARALCRPQAGRILLYHRITAGGPIEAVPADVFRGHLRAIEEADLAPASVLACVRSGFPDDLVALSFDDGHASTRAACEDLLAQGRSMTLFVVPDWVDRRLPDALPWSVLRALADGGAEIGIHGLRHELLVGTDLGPLVTILREARARLADGLGREASGLAYPFGAAPRAARKAAMAAGSLYACTAVPGANSRATDPFALHRNEVHGTDRPRDVLRKLAGTDDWFAPIRQLQDRVRYGA